MDGEAVTGHAEDESQLLTRLTQQIELCIQEISCLRSEKLVLERRITEKRPPLPLPPTNKGSPKITKQLILAFVNKLENAYQYFDFKEYIVDNRLLDSLPLSGPDSRPAPFVHRLANDPDLKHKFNKLSTEDREEALRACIEDRILDESVYYRNLSLRHLQRQHGYTDEFDDTLEPSQEEIDKYTKMFPSLQLPTAEEMKELRGDRYVASDPILDLVKQVREESYVMDENLVVELQMLMKSHSFRSFFDEFSETVSTQMEEDGTKDIDEVSTQMEEDGTKDIDDLLSKVEMLNAQIYALEAKKVQNQIEKNKIERMHQLKLDATMNLQFQHDNDELFIKYKKLLERLEKARELSSQNGRTSTLQDGPTLQ